MEKLLLAAAPLDCLWSAQPIKKKATWPSHRKHTLQLGEAARELGFFFRPLLTTEQLSFQHFCTNFQLECLEELCRSMNELIFRIIRPNWHIFEWQRGAAPQATVCRLSRSALTAHTTDGAFPDLNSINEATPGNRVFVSRRTCSRAVFDRYAKIFCERIPSDDSQSELSSVFRPSHTRRDLNSGDRGAVINTNHGGDGGRQLDGQNSDSAPARHGVLRGERK